MSLKEYIVLFVCLFVFVCSLEYYLASLMDKLLSAMYFISSKWDMHQCVQFPTVAGFVDIQSYVWEKTMWKQNKKIKLNKKYTYI